MTPFAPSWANGRTWDNVLSFAVRIRRPGYAWDFDTDFYVVAKSCFNLQGVLAGRRIAIRGDLPPGTYRFRLGLLDPKTSPPAVLLAIKGPTA